jgi:mannosyltransferase
MSATTSGSSRAPARPSDDDTRSALGADSRWTDRLARFTPAFDTLATVVVVLAVVAGLVLRFVQRSDLWLDEALSVNIASLPLGDITDALRHDGHPPLYYALLHGWMQLVGDSDQAVRALSGIFSVAALPLAWIAGRRIGGRPVALAALVLLAVSPFAVHYGSETRPYSLVMLLVLAGWLLLDDALRRPTVARLVGLAVLSGVLLLTHYWSMWLLAAVGLCLLWRAWRGPSPAEEAGHRGPIERRSALRCAAALAGGLVIFLPWVGLFLHQAEHTGTPWATVVRPTAAVALTFEDFGGGDFLEARLLGIVLAVLVLLGLTGLARDGRHIELDLRTRPPVRWEALTVVLTLGLALAASYAATSTYATRYASVFFPILLLVSAAGLACFVGRAGRAVAYAAVIGLGLACSVVIAFSAPRTQAGVIADAIVADAAPGDLVVVCPDQLGPATEHQLSDEDVEVVAYPTLGDARFVDWEDYGERNAAADPNAIAAEVDERAGPDAAVWLVLSGDYRTFEGQCEALAASLSSLRPAGGPVVAEDGDEYFEHAGLSVYPATTAEP